MKRVTISYVDRAGQTKLAKSNTQDKATRKMSDHNGHMIHPTAKKGRLDTKALLTRCDQYGITLDYVKIDVNGNTRFTYEANSKKTEPIAEPIRISKQKAVIQSEPKPIAKVEPIAAEPIVIEPPMSEPSNLPIDKPIEPSSQVSSNGTKPNAADPFSTFADLMKPYLQQAEINQEQVNDMIKDALSKHSKTITVNNAKTGTSIKVGKQHYMFDPLLQLLNLRINVLIVGAAGSGKTFAASEVAKALELPYYAISVGAMTTKTDFMGYMNANGNYVITLFRQAFEHGGVFLLDEVDAANANVLTTINMALANGECAFPDGMIKKHNDFVIIAGANTYGHGGNTQYVGRNQLDAATLDRFAVLDWGYDEELEEMLSSNRRWTSYVQSCRRNLNNTKMRYVISPRASITGGRLIDAGMNVEDVKKYILFKGMTDEDIVTVTNGTKY